MYGKPISYSCLMLSLTKLTGGHEASCVFANKNPTHFVCRLLRIHIKSIKMGRPKKELKSLKIIQVNVRMTVDDYSKVSINAKTIGLSIVEYIRRKITEKPLPKKKVSPSDRKLFVELSRVGNNLNQLTRVTNSGIRDPFGINKQLEEVKAVLQYLKSNIANNDR